MPTSPFEPPNVPILLPKGFSTIKTHFIQITSAGFSQIEAIVDGAIYPSINSIVWIGDNPLFVKRIDVNLKDTEAIIEVYCNLSPI